MHNKLLRQPWLRALPWAALAGLGAVAGCGARASDGPPPPPPTFTVALTQGQSATVAPGAVLRLERVNDSRCRTGAVCVWAGYISYSFTLSKGGARSSFVLAADMPGASKRVSQDGLSFTLLGVEPDRVPRMKEAAPDYRVSVQVSPAPGP